MNTSKQERYNLRQYTRLTIAFFICLFFLTVYQYIFLYFKGAVEMIFGSSFFVAVAHQLGFACMVSMLLIIPFNFLENLRPKRGFQLSFILLAMILVVETILITYFCMAMRPLESHFGNPLVTVFSSLGVSLLVLVGVVTIVAVLLWCYRVTSKHYKHVLKMYPFTIILFTLFVSTLFLDGKPINQNKTQHLMMASKKVTSKNIVKRKFWENSTNSEKTEFTDSEMVWINSLYNGNNSDKYFLIARDFAFEHEFDKALLLCRYILSEHPEHIDALILTGRTHAWSGDYHKAEDVLKKAIIKEPTYKDAYAALIDVHYWAEDDEKVESVYQNMKKANVLDAMLLQKVERSRLRIRRTASATLNP